MEFQKAKDYKSLIKILRMHELAKKKLDRDRISAETGDWQAVQQQRGKEEREYQEELAKAKKYFDADILTLKDNQKIEQFRKAYEADPAGFVKMAAKLRLGGLEKMFESEKQRQAIERQTQELQDQAAERAGEPTVEDEEAAHAVLEHVLVNRGAEEGAPPETILNQLAEQLQHEGITLRRRGNKYILNNEALDTNEVLRSYVIGLYAMTNSAAEFNALASQSGVPLLVVPNIYKHLKKKITKETLMSLDEELNKKIEQKYGNEFSLSPNIPDITETYEHDEEDDPIQLLTMMLAEYDEKTQELGGPTPQQEKVLERMVNLFDRYRAKDTDKFFYDKAHQLAKMARDAFPDWSSDARDYMNTFYSFRTHEGKGIKRKKGKGMGKAVFSKIFARLEILIGERNAGNNSKAVDNEIYDILDFLLEHKKISKAEHKGVVKELGLVGA